MKLKLHDFIDKSEVNGPGVRCVIWVQGCSLACSGCFNQDTHDFAGGSIWDVDDLVQKVIALEGEIDGVTISGGEPLQQLAAVTKLVEEIKNKSRLSIVLFTGFSMEEIAQMPKSKQLLSKLDILIAGRYVKEKRLAQNLIGSTNKTVHFLSEKYDLRDLEEIAACEVSISESGEIKVTGIDPLVLR